MYAFYRIFTVCLPVRSGMKFKIIALIVMVVGCVQAKKNTQTPHPEPQQGELLFAPHFKKVLIGIEKGDIAIECTEGDEKASVKYEQKPFAKYYSFVCEVQQDTLVIKFKKKAGLLTFSAPTSTVNLVLKVPKKVSVVANTGLGFLSVHGLKGALECNYGSGKLFITAPHSSIKCKIGTGDVIIEYPQMPKKQCPISVSGSVIKAQITLPGAARVYAQQNNSALFAYNNDFGTLKNAKDAHFVVAVGAGTGSLDIIKRL